MASTKILLGLLAGGMLALSPWTVRANIVRHVEKTFAVQPGGTLTVSTEGGDVRVTTGEALNVKVTAVEKIRASSEAEAEKLLGKLALAMTQTGNDVQASAKYESSRPFLHFGDWPPVEVSFIIAVPENYNASIRTSGGDITIGDLTGRLDARTSGGDVKLGRIDGKVTVRTSGGDIEAGGLDGPAELLTSGGDITINETAGALQASTSGGDVTVRYHGRLAGDSDLATSGGEIRVQVPPDAGFNLDAATSGGEVEAEGLTITIAHGGAGKDRLAGTVNGGGPRLKLRTSGGDISVRVRESR